MRIQAITEVNTQQQYPSHMQNTDSKAVGKSESLGSFKEHLRLQIQDSKAPTATRKAEVVAVNSLWGYLIPQGLSPKPEQKIKTRAYVSLSNL